MNNVSPGKATAVFFLLTIAAFAAGPTLRAGKKGAVPVRELRVAAGNANLFVRVAGKPGSGKVLLALNGGPGLSSRYMTDLETLVDSGLTLVTFDQRGVGRSSMPAAEAKNFRFEDYLADIEAVRKRLKLKSFTLLGHSWGGMLALKYAAAYPTRVDSLILIGSGPIRDSDFKAFLAKMRKRVVELIRQGVIDPKLERHADIYPAYLSDPRFKPHADLLTDLNERVQNLTMEAIGGYDLTNDMAGINQRVLLLWGADDPLGLDSIAATKAALSLARTELVVIQGCGHFWQEKPREFLQSIQAFMHNERE